MANLPSTSNSPNRNENTSGQGPYYMTEDILKERAESEHGGRYSTQLYAGIVGNGDVIHTFITYWLSNCIKIATDFNTSVSSISFGTVLGWSSPAIRASIEDTNKAVSSTIIEKSDADIGTIASLAPLGCSIGVLLWSYCDRKIGPKKTMVLQSPLLFVTWIVIALARTLNIAIVCRFLCGFLAISYRVCGETLLLDTVHRVHLRYMVISYRSCVYVGVLLSYVCGYCIRDKYFSILNCVIVAIHFVMLLMCPESPVYLYDVNIKQAEEALSWYRGKQNTYIEMRNIKRDSEIRKVDHAASKYMMYSKVVIKAIAIVVGVSAANVVSGYSIFLYYNPAMVRKVSDDGVTTIKRAQLDSKIDVMTRNWDAIFLAMTMFLSTLISTWVHYNVLFGIKKPLIISCASVTMVLALFSTYHFLRDSKIQYLLKNNWTYTILVHMLVVSFEIGLSSCGDIMLMDYLPSQVYQRAKLITKFSQWILIFALTRSYFSLTSVIKGAGTWTLLCGLSLIGLIFLSCFTVESKGKTLVKIQTELGGNPIGTRAATHRRFRFNDPRNSTT